MAGGHAIEAYAEAGLPIPSVVRPAKITTIDARDAEAIGRLGEPLTNDVLSTVRGLLAP